MEKSQLQQIRDYVRRTGITRVSKKAKVSRRSLHYLIKGEYNPSYATLQKLLKEMGN